MKLLKNIKLYLSIILTIFALFFISGCFGDDEKPEINFDDVYEINNKYYKYYTGDIVIISGIVTDNKSLSYLKNDGEILEITNDGRFTTIISGDKTKTEFSARDTSGNTKSITIELRKDNTLPSIKNIWVNSKLYNENMVFGNENEMLFEIEITDDNYIKEVKLDNEIMQYNKEKGVYNYLFKRMVSGENNIIIQAVDGAGNSQYRYLKFIYDAIGPEIINIKINNENYFENIKYGHKNINVFFNLIDDSLIRNVYIDGIEKGVITYFNYELATGVNIITLKAEDYYGNISEKQLRINYITGIPEINDFYIKLNGNNINEYNGYYYINNTNFNIGAKLYSGSNELKLKEIIFNGKVISELYNVNEIFEKNVSVTENINQSIILELKNEAFLTKSMILNLIYDTTAPIIKLTPDTEIFYTDKNKLKIKDLFVVEASDNYFLKEIKYYVNNILIDENIEFSVQEENDISIEAIDYAENKTIKNIILKSDKSGPEIKNIKINDVEYFDNMKYGEKTIKISLEIIDENSVFSFYVNGILNENKEYFYYSLTEGENIIKLETEDMYKNKTIKNLYINYVRGIPIINNIVLNDTNGNLYYSEGRYYTNQSIVNIYCELYSGNDMINLKNLYINGEKNAFLNTAASIYSGQLNVGLTGENLFTFTLENESHLRYDKDLKIVYDIVRPVIYTEPLQDVLYVNKDTLKIEDYINVTVIDNNEKIKYIKYFINGELIEKNSYITLSNNSILSIMAEDYAGNNTSKDMMIEKDTGLPKIYSIQLLNDFQKIDFIDYPKELLIPYKENDEQKIKIKIDAYDEETGIKNIKYNETIITNNEIEIDLQSSGKIIIEDYAGNKLEKNIKVINFENIVFNYGETGESIYNLNINEYYVGASNIKMNYSCDAEVKGWYDDFYIPTDFNYIGEAEVKYLSEGINTRKFYIMDKNGNKSSYYFKLYYDMEPPYINKNDIEIDNVKYADNMKIVVSDNLLIRFMTEDASGISNIMVTNGIFESKDEDGAYYYKISKDDLTEGNNTIEIIITDNIGNNKKEILYLYINKIDKIILNVKEISERYVRLEWKAPLLPYDYNYRLYIEELTPEGDKINRELYETDYIVWDLKDNTPYKFKIKLEGTQFYGEVYSTEVAVKTLNAIPLKIDFQSIKTYIKDKNTYFKLNWQKVNKLDEHDFYSYEISVSEDNKIYKIISKITNKEVCEFDYMIPKQKNSNPESLYEYIKTDNKLYYFRLRIEDKSETYSKEAKINEYSYNEPPDLTFINFNVEKLIETGQYIMNIEFQDISKEIELTEYRVYRINKSEDKRDMIAALSVSNIGKINIHLKKDYIYVNEYLEEGKVKIIDRDVKADKTYSYMIEVQDKDIDVNGSTSDDIDCVSYYETQLINTY